VADRRRRRTTTSAYSDGDTASGATRCDLLPIDRNHYTTLDNRSVSVRFPASLRGVYELHQYTYIAGKLSTSDML